MYPGRFWNKISIFIQKEGTIMRNTGSISGAKLLREREHENVRGAAVMLGIEKEKEEAAE